MLCRPCVIVHETDITTGEQLGTGGFSVVYRGTWLGTPVAIKKWLNNGTSESERNEMRGEIMSNAVSCFLLKPLHPSLVSVVHRGGDACSVCPLRMGLPLVVPPAQQRGTLTLTPLGICMILNGCSA